MHGSIASEEKKQAMTAESLSSQKVSKALFEASQGFTHSRFQRLSPFIKLIRFYLCSIAFCIKLFLA